MVRGKGLFLLHRAAKQVEKGLNIINMDLANEGLGLVLYLGMDLYH